MLAVVKSRSEPGIEVLDRPEPSITRDDSVLLEVAACGVCGTDLHFYDWTTTLGHDITSPRILGHEVAGTVLDVGHAVTESAAFPRRAAPSGVFGEGTSGRALPYGWCQGLQ